MPLTKDDYTLRIYQYGYLTQEQTYGRHTDIHQSIEWLPYTADIRCFWAGQYWTTQAKIPCAWATSVNGDR